MSSKKSANRTAQRAERRRLRNRSIKSGVKTLVTRAEGKIAAKDTSATEEIVGSASPRNPLAQ